MKQCAIHTYWLLFNFSCYFAVKRFVQRIKVIKMGKISKQKRNMPFQHNAMEFDNLIWNLKVKSSSSSGSHGSICAHLYSLVQMRLLALLTGELKEKIICCNGWNWSKMPIKAIFNSKCNSKWMKFCWRPCTLKEMPLSSLPRVVLTQYPEKKKNQRFPPPCLLITLSLILVHAAERAPR